ncbi:MAG TPA: hypothetical protein VJP02_05430 [Candidatus Sulfotelmatobacter sp.]|nr:hypothetical protein [Candidatus Sulfotelmatobacter sp.]
MKKHALVLGMILLPTLAMAAPPDFSGSWIRNSTGSDPMPNQMYWVTRGAAGGGGSGRGGRGGGEVTLTVEQDAKTLQVGQSNEIARKYTLDGKAHTRPTDTGIQKAEDTAHLEGDSLVIDTAEPFGGMPGNAILKIKETWSLSPDGKTLTITTTRDIPARHQTFKEVYTKTQAQPGAICSAGCIGPQ